VVKYLDTVDLPLPKVAVTSPEQVAAVIREYIQDAGVEHFLVLALDGRHKLAALRLVSKGTPTATIVHPREVFQVAILNGCTAVVIAHNHPSGDPRPSSEDDAITRRIAQAGEILGIKLLDHVVVGNETYFSYTEDRREFLEARGDS
jgi:DNA repair protein RadC